MTARQGRLLLARQLTQLPRWLDQARYNGPPTTYRGNLEGRPQDYASNPAVSADGRYVAYEAYRQKLPLAVKLGENGVLRTDLRTRSTTLASRIPADGPSGPNPVSFYNPAITADGRWVSMRPPPATRTSPSATARSPSSRGTSAPGGPPRPAARCAPARSRIRPTTPTSPRPGGACSTRLSAAVVPSSCRGSAGLGASARCSPACPPGAAGTPTPTSRRCPRTACGSPSRWPPAPCPTPGRPGPRSGCVTCARDSGSSPAARAAAAARWRTRSPPTRPCRRTGASWPSPPPTRCSACRRARWGCSSAICAGGAPGASSRPPGRESWSPRSRATAPSSPSPPCEAISPAS